MVAFDIAQFFLSLNYSILTAILQHSSFADYIVSFLSHYLVDRSIQYPWNSFLSNACNADVGMGQGSALSPILSILYIASIFHLFEQQAQVLNLDSSILSSVDDSLLVSQEKCITKPCWSSLVAIQ